MSINYSTTKTYHFAEFVKLIKLFMLEKKSKKML